tara:strand:- start:2228 stop:2614 length:387 start_codon:yes stop_codon:yes gene_type:complete
MWFELLKQPELSMGNVGLVDLSNVPEEDDDCCNKFKDEAITWAKKWTSVEYHEFLYTLNCEEVYEAMNVYLISDVREQKDIDYKNIIFYRSREQAQKEIEDIKNRWDKECKKDKEYSERGASWWHSGE